MYCISCGKKGVHWPKYKPEACSMRCLAWRVLAEYQGTVKTDADRETIRRWADQFIARHYNDGSVGLDAFDNIPTSVLALNYLRIGNAPIHGYGCFGKDAAEV